MPNHRNPLTLGAQNRAVLEPYLKPLPDAIRQSVLDQLQTGYESRVVPNPPQQDDVAPSFELSDARGVVHRLSDYDKPVVLPFFRGGWCDFCTTALQALQRRYPAITTHGGEVLAISPDSPEANRRTAKKLQLPFPLLSDSNNRTADQYGLRASIAPLLAPIYSEHNIAFPQDCELLNVPYPATFIVRSNGRVATTFVDSDPSVRMDPQDIAGIIRQL